MTATCRTATVVELSGHLDLAVAPTLWQTLVGACRQNPSDLRVDATAVRTVDMVCAGLLVGACARQHRLGRQFVLSNVPDPVARVLRLAGVLDQLTTGVRWPVDGPGRLADVPEKLPAQRPPDA